MIETLWNKRSNKEQVISANQPHKKRNNFDNQSYVYAYFQMFITCIRLRGEGIFMLCSTINTE